MSVNFAGIVPNNYPVNTRILIDTNYVVNIALPNAANTVNTNNLNLLNATPFPTTETINVQVLTTQSTGANSKNINIVLQHTPANSDGTANSAAWANIPQLAAPLVVIAGNATNFPAYTDNNGVVKLPPNTKQFIRAQATGEANGGNASDGTLTLQLLF